MQQGAELSCSGAPCFWFSLTTSFKLEENVYKEFGKAYRGDEASRNAGNHRSSSAETWLRSPRSGFLLFALWGSTLFPEVTLLKTDVLMGLPLYKRFPPGRERAISLPLILLYHLSGRWVGVAALGVWFDTRSKQVQNLKTMKKMTKAMTNELKNKCFLYIYI